MKPDAEHARRHFIGISRKLPDPDKARSAEEVSRWLWMLGNNPPHDFIVVGVKTALRAFYGRFRHH